MASSRDHVEVLVGAFKFGVVADADDVEFEAESTEVEVSLVEVFGFGIVVDANDEEFVEVVTVEFVECKFGVVVEVEADDAEFENGADDDGSDVELEKESRLYASSD